MNNRMNRTWIIITISIFALFSQTEVSAQNRTWLTYEVGISRNSQKWNTKLNEFHSFKSKESIIGGYIEQEINSYLSIEIGVNDKFYGFDASYFGNDTTNLEAYAQCMQIPLRLRTRLNLLRRKLYLSPHIGAGLLIKSYSGIGTFPKHENFDIEIKTDFPKTACLMEAGVSLEYILKSWKFAFLTTANYSAKELVNYSVKNMDTSFKSNGNYITYQIRVGYAISNLWKRDKVS